MLHNPESKLGHFRYRNQKFPRGDNLDNKALSRVSGQQNYYKSLHNLKRKLGLEVMAFIASFQPPFHP